MYYMIPGGRVVYSRRGKFGKPNNKVFLIVLIILAIVCFFYVKVIKMFLPH
jgi:hypothetical protein